jgi:predicted nucleotidyltransferase
MSLFDQILEEKADALALLCQKYGVVRLKIFGSALTPKFDPKISDLDFLVEFGDPPQGMKLSTQFFGLLDELESLFDRRIDLLEESAIINTRLKKSATTTAQTLYAA